MSADREVASVVPTIVLVHGAFADGSSWRHVIPVLEDDGYRVIAVQNPLTSFAEDLASTRRVIDAQPGPVVLVGHSYGGTVISRAAFGARNVEALVYVAAFAPDAGEVMQALLMAYPSKLGVALVADSAGFLSIDRAKFADVFAGDVSEPERRVLAATQKPIKGDILHHVCDAPAWRQVPSWYLVATEDQALNPDLQRLFATRMRATTHEVKASHVPFVSNPVAVVAIIEAAASVRTVPAQGPKVPVRMSASPTVH